MLGFLTYETRLPIYTWSFEPPESLAICRAKAVHNYTVPSFLSYFETLSIGLVLEIEPMTSHSAVEHSAD